jgi:hypothetical protein
MVYMLGILGMAIRPVTTWPRCIEWTCAQKGNVTCFGVTPRLCAIDIYLILIGLQASPVGSSVPVVDAVVYAGWQ